MDLSVFVGGIVYHRLTGDLSVDTRILSRTYTDYNNRLLFFITINASGLQERDTMRDCFYAIFFMLIFV